MRKLIIPIMLLLLAAPALAYVKGDLTSLVQYKIANPTTLANGTIIQYTPECFNECWLPVELTYSGSMETATKTLRSEDVTYALLDVKDRQSREMDIEYYYVSYEYAEASTWVPDESCVLKNGTVSCDKGAWVNETKWGNFLRPLTEVIMQKDLPKVLVIRGRGSGILGSSVDVIPTIFGYEMLELAVWNATWTLGSPGAIVEMMGVQIQTNNTMETSPNQCFEGIRRDPTLTGLTACQLWNQTDTGSITNLVNGSFSGDWCNFTSTQALQDNEYYFVTTSGGSSRTLSASIFCTPAGCGTNEIDTGFFFNVTGGVFYNAGSWANNDHNTGVTQAFNIYNFSFVSCLGGCADTDLNLLIDGTGSNKSWGYNPSREVNISATINESVWIAIDINGSMVANDTGESGYVEYNFTDIAGGWYNVTAYYVGDGTYCDNNETFWIEIQAENTSTSLWINGTTPQTWNSSYPNSTLNVSALINVSVPVSIQRNGTIICEDTPSCENITLYGAGMYNFTANFSGNENYTTSQQTRWANISLGSNPISLSSNATWNITYPKVAQITGAGNVTDADLQRNGSIITNPSAVLLGAGAYNFTWNATATANYSANSTSNTLTVNKGTTVLTISYNISSPAVIGSVINVTCSANNDNEGIGWQLYNDTHHITGYPNVTNIWDTVGLSSGVYNFTCNQSATANWSGSIENSSFTLAAAGSFVIDHVYDENNITKSLTFDVEVYNSTYSTYNTSVTSFNSEAVKGNVTVVISADGYGTRYYYTNVPENGTTNMTGYLVNESDGHNVQFTVKNYYEQLQADVLINVSRLYSSWTIVGQGTTDISGTFVLFADDDANYKLTFAKAGYTTLESNQLLSLSSYTVYLNSGTVEKPSFWDVYRDLSSSCTFSNASRTVNCTWNDTSSHLTNITLEVRTVNSTGHMWMLCNNTSVSNNGTFLCNAGTLNNQTYIWSMWGDTSSEPTSILLESGSWTDVAAAVVLGTTGLIIVLLFTMFSGFIGVQMGSPIITVIMTTLGVGFSYALGFLTLGTAAVSILIGLALSAGVMVWKMRSDEK